MAKAYRAALTLLLATTSIFPANAQNIGARQDSDSQQVQDEEYTKLIGEYLALFAAQERRSK